jgi:N-acetylglucosaminyldiphosphoundecaprenol N-acetyl-beta-D-mannosaminyltransferase
VTQLAERSAGSGALPRIHLAGVSLDAVFDFSAKELLRPLLGAPHCQHVITANADYLRLAAGNANLREVVNSAALVVPDGMPLVWAAKLSGASVSGRVTGHDLTQALAEISAAEGTSIFLLGAAPGVAHTAAATLEVRYPGARIAGVYSPPSSPYPYPADEDRRMLEAVNGSGAGALLVALGCPKQDLWIAAHRHELKPAVAIGVGGVFDVLAGNLTRAPKWAQRTGLEWLYRMAQEPRRLGGRYFLDAVFLLRLFAVTGLRRLMSVRGGARP